MSKVNRKIIEIDEERCDGCGQCVPACAEGAIQVIDGKAKLIADKYCDGLGACLGDCPNDALLVVERDADEFDEEAVEEHLKTFGKETQAAEHAISILGGQVQQVIPVELLGLAETRHLVVIKKVARTPIKYPRRPGLPAKRPLKAGHQDMDV